MSRASIRQCRRAGCSCREATLIMGPSQGRTPEWFATTRVGPVEGTRSIPVVSTRHHTEYMNSKKGRMVSVNFGS